MKRRYPKKVGEILIEKGLITLDQLTKGLAEQTRHGTSLGSSLVRLGFVEYRELESVLAGELQKVESLKIGEILVESKVITQDQLSKALEAQRGSSGKLLGEVLIDMGFLNQSQLTDALSIQFDVRHVSVEEFLFKPDVVALLDAAAAQKYRAIPLRAAGKQLMLATDEPFNLKRIQTLEKITKMTIEPVYADGPQLDEVIRREYGIGEFKTDDDRPPDQADAGEAEKKAALVLTQAIAEGASFIHLDPSLQNLTIRFRIDGQLHPQSPLRPRLGVAFTDYLKAMARLDPLNRRSIQTGYFSFKAEGAETNFKISTFPVLVGYNTFREKATLKVLNRQGGLEHLEDLGFYMAVLERYRHVLGAKGGVVIVAGTIDGGITTTLYGSLRKIQNENLGISTIERSIETFLPGVAQTQVDTDKGLSFKESLRSVLLEDTDALMVSEIDDSDTAALIFQSALGGMRILTSMMAPDATTVIKILRDMGVDPLQMASGLGAVLAQRLVRRICPQCRESYQPASELLNQLRMRPGTPFFRGKGCQLCNFSGLRGRVGVFELFVPDDTLRNSIASGLSAEEIRRTAVNSGMLTMRMDGLKKVLEGITPIEQVLGMGLKT